jgi:hypothetical protein
MLIADVVDTDDKLFRGVNDTSAPAENVSSVSLAPAINPCHRFSVIAGVVDTGDTFITGAPSVKNYHW